jgi:hypothetical protein
MFEKSSNISFVNMESFESEEIPKKRFKYNPEQMLMAIEAVQRGELSQRCAAIRFEVPQTTLSTKLRDVYEGKKSGPAPMLSEEEESYLKKHIFECAKVGVGYTNKDLIDSAVHIIGCRKDQAARKVRPPTYGWIQKFLNRCPDIAIRTAQMVSKASAPITKSMLLTFYDEVSSYRGSSTM